MALIKSICVLTIYFTSLLTISGALYEDQVGKFDWKKSFVGKPKFAEFDGRRIIVGTDENVVAALSPKSGNILWRQVLEDPKKHSIKYLKVASEIYSVSGDDTTWILRVWDSASGSLINEWISTYDKRIPYEFEVNGESLYFVGHDDSTLIVKIYDIQRGIVKQNFVIPFTSQKESTHCVLSKLYYSCAVGKEVHYLQINENSKKEVATFDKSIDNIKIKPYSDKDPAILVITSPVNAQILYYKDGQHVLHPLDVMPNAIGLSHSGKSVAFHLEGTKNPTHILIKSTIIEDSDELSEEFEYPQGLGKPDIAAGQCSDSSCNLLLSSADDALLLVKFPEGKVLWTREEALSQIVASEFLELPVSELDASIEDEFTENNVIGMFFHRISTQAKQLASLFGNQLLSKTGLVRDDFGLHKIIVVATKSGKLFGIDTLTGSLAWTYRLPNIRPFKVLGNDKMFLHVQRSTRYSPFPAQCILLAEDANTGYGVFIQFDPITGFSENSIVKLNYRIRQATLLPTEDKDHIKPLIVLSEDNEVFIYPESANAMISTKGSNTYLYTVDSRTKELKGFYLHREQNSLEAIPSWTVNLGDAHLVALSAKSPIERVHSQGRVLPDRSVHYKYVNPNLLALATLSDDPVHKSVLSIYLIDAVNGFVVYSTSHKRAKGPIHLVHSENWLVYSFFSERYRRTEVVAAELYEGPTQSNSTVFSSLAVSQLTQVLTQSYILPSFPLTMAVSLTERGITNKYLFFALNSGVVEIPWLLLQPRFADAACGPEESCIPYMPEIPLPHEAYINYNQTLGRISGIAVAPAKLESTSHVLVYGLDLFYTRVAPSKTFDLLKEDFDHILIILVLVGLIVASFISKYFAAQKVLKQAWK
ncbi:ER membrane protein complex subunit 1 [Aethina tumida]|uniref:ER membrane protein complex subunit 1 n=1 Tax=Aethina tumida TaxID=116153 RepID=UPI0021497ADA|nr:ER membrane protein complex subunit 1 [Aethina tumida]